MLIAGTTCTRAQVLIDQSTYGPLCNILFISFITLLLEGRTRAYLKQKLQEDYPRVQLNSWKVGCRYRVCIWCCSFHKYRGFDQF